MHSDSESSSSLSSPTSSFFFSSTQPSPGLLHSHTPDDALIVPEISLPAQLLQQSPVGPTLGDIRLLVLGNHPDVLIKHNPAIVDSGEWQDIPGGRLRVASSSWTPNTLAPSRNIHITHAQPQFASTPTSKTSVTEPNPEVEALRDVIEAPFRQITRVIHPDTSLPADPLLATLISSPTSPLFTALLVLLPDPSPPSDSNMDTKDSQPESDRTTPDWDSDTLRTLAAALAPQIPTILFPPTSPPGDSAIHQSDGAAFLSSSKDLKATMPAPLSEFTPSSVDALQRGLFGSPETLTLLRAEAAEGFMRWREAQLVEQTIRIIDEDGGLASSKKFGSLSLRRRQQRQVIRRWLPPNANDSGEEGQSISSDGGDIYGPLVSGKELVILGVVGRQGRVWDKARWEQEWMARQDDQLHSEQPHPVTTSGDGSGGTKKRTREGTITQRKRPYLPSSSPSMHALRQSVSNSGGPDCAPFDPLHLPSLLLFSVSLLTPIRLRVQQTLGDLWDAFQGRSKNAHLVQIALFSGFCVGFGVGYYVR